MQRVAILLTCLLLAGCTDAQPEADQAIQGIATVADLQAIAEAEALKWSPNATLATIEGFEKLIASSYDDDGKALEFYEPVYGGGDDVMGDGITNAWLFVYSTLDASLDVIVTMKGQVSSQEFTYVAPLANATWSVAPGPAFAAVQEIRPDILNASIPDAFVEYKLLDLEGTLVWEIGCLRGTLDDQWFTASHVDANTGEVLAIGGLAPEPPAPPKPPTTYGGTLEGTITYPETTATETITVGERYLDFTLDITLAPLLSSPSVVMTDPAGVETDVSDGVHLKEPAPGLYTLTVSFSGPDRVDYSIFWCTYADGVGCN